MKSELGLQKIQDIFKYFKFKHLSKNPFEIQS